MFLDECRVFNAVRFKSGLSLHCRLGLPWCFIRILWEYGVSLLLSEDMMINGQLGYVFLDCNLEKSTYFFLESPFTSLLYLSQGVKCSSYTFWCTSCCVIRYLYIFPRVPLVHPSVGPKHLKTGRTVGPLEGGLSLVDRRCLLLTCDYLTKAKHRAVARCELL